MARKLLSQKFAERVKPKDKPVQYHDPTIPGFVLRVQPSGSKIWKLIQNRKPQTIGRFPAITFEMAKEQAGAILRGEVESQSRQPMTLDLFLNNHYEPYASSHFTDPDSELARLKRFGIGSFLLDEIKLADIETWRTERRKAGVSANTINRDVATLHSALQSAVDWDLLDQHPLAKLKPLKVDKKKIVRYLSTDEEKRLYEALVARDDKKREERTSANTWRQERGHDLYPQLGTYCDNLTPMVILAINTGLRRGELWNLKWGDVDLRHQMLTVHGSGAKSKQTRHVPLNASAVQTLKTHRGEAAALPHVEVFGRAEFRKAWNGVLKDAKIENFRFHDLRHTFASKLVMNGVPLNTVRELMGHASIDMTLIYAHLAPENLREAVEKLDMSGGQS